jgi:hypothetical protein
MYGMYVCTRYRYVSEFCPANFKSSFWGASLAYYIEQTCTVYDTSYMYLLNKLVFGFAMF